MAEKKRKKRTQQIKQHIKFEAYGILLFALFSYELVGKGAVGYFLKAFFRLLLGNLDFTLSLIGIYIALSMMIKRKFSFPWTMRKTGLLFLYIAIITLAHQQFIDQLQMHGQYTDANIFSVTWQELAKERASEKFNQIVGSGMIGAFFYLVFNYLFDRIGTNVLIVTFILVGLLLSFHLSYVQFIKKIKKRITLFYERFETFLKDKLFVLKTRYEKRKPILENDEEENHPLEANGPIIHDFMNQTNLDQNHSEPLQLTEHFQLSALNVKENDDESQLNDVQLQIMKEEDENYQLPSTTLLKPPTFSDQFEEHRDISNNAKKLEKTLESFGVRARVVQIHRGPAVTRYEIQPDIGVKVSRIVNLADDLALSLAAKDIRIEAPIPGKAAIGIEVPNSEIAVVTLREVIESQPFNESQSKLSIALGRDITGKAIIGNLAKMPHLLVAGATGSGKSVCINGMITSILYKAKPSEVKFLMIDPKMVELNVYNGIPHLITPVVTDPKKAAKALKMIVNEMEKRYESFAQKGARDIERYNSLLLEESFGQAQILPYIVVIIDELADLMMVAPNDVEDSIIRLAQKARAAGIHLIVATQRPSVDVITGLIKANIPSRIAFGVSSQTDSRTIIDMAGAEKLLGRGDMLYFPVGFSKPIRVQGAFISEQEVEAVVQFVKVQQQVTYQEEIIPDLNQHQEETEEVEDELYYEAVKLVVENKQASVSLLQRRFRIGYTRAARLIDAMEANGIVGPYEGSKPRKVLLTKEDLDEFKIPS
ncbi:DNA translocase FtsK [Tepidibacillus sp. LV47]|uniref:DNA translocase FtsK n=1 Tax=Tepidibacillus sp. LV47 TaxID=3398228 RepID=UPI003AAF8D2A